jgi:O-glycosyl hydrolase
MKITKILSLMLFSPIFVMAQTANVNLSSTKQVIRGFGGMNHVSWAGDLTASQRSTAFENGSNQLGLTICRIFVDGDSTQWSRELPTAKAAQATGALVFASPWNPPAALAETFTRNGTASKRVRYDAYAAYAQHLINYVEYMKRNGVNLYAISVQNEPDWGYTWTWWTAAEMLKFMQENAGELRKHCRVMAPESLGYVKSMSDPILNDATALGNMDILGTHTYGTSFSNFTYPLFKTKGAGKELWMTEVYYPNSDTNSSDKWPEALETGLHIHKAMSIAEFQAYVWWYIRREYSFINENGTISKRGYMMAHFSKFVRPGYVRVDATENPTTDVYVSAYKKDQDITIVVLNKNATAKTLTISVPGATVPRWERYVTTGTSNLAKGANIYTKTSLQVTLDAQSMTTFVGKAEFGAPELNTANPENESFDLPLTTNTFQFVYNNKVDCSKAIAKMVGPNKTDTIPLELKQTGFSDTLTFKLPISVSLVKGDYSVIVSGLISDYNLSAKANTVVAYSIGASENSVAETIFSDNLDAGGLIPAGWKVTWGTTVREQNTTGLSSGPRLLDFPNGGDFKAAFYIRDESSTSHLTYGTYDGARLHLNAGKQIVSFYYSWWTVGAQSNNRKIEFAVLSKSGATVFESKDVSTTSLITSNTAIPTGSKLNEFEVTIPADGDYILEWRTVNFGWDGALVGNIKITNSMTRATKYKSLLAAALTTANQAKMAADSSLYDGEAKNALLQAINTYSTATFTAPSAVQAAIDLLKANGDALLAHKTYVNDYITSLATANNRVATYGTTKYNQTAPYLKLVQKIGLYGAINYSNDASLKTAIDSLNLYSTMTLNWINNAIPALTYRLNKAIVLAEKVGVATSAIEPARNALTDDNTVVSNLHTSIKSALTNALATGTLRFGKSSENVAFTDSLEMTSFIKNPNFYTQQATSGISATTFPGWTVTTNTSTDAGPDVLATSVNPVVDTDVKLYNTSMGRFEQTLSGLPSGYYNIYMKTRIPTNVVSAETYVFYALVNGADSLKATFRPGALADRLQTGFRNIKITDGYLKFGVRVGLDQIMDPTVRWGDPTLWMVNSDVLSVRETNIDTSIKEVQFYTIMGQRLNGPVKGLYLEKVLYDSGKVTVEKVLNY